MPKATFKAGDLLIHRRSEAFYEVMKVTSKKGLYHLRKMAPHAHLVFRTFMETHGHFDRIHG